MNYALFLNLLAALYLIHFKDKSITEVFAHEQDHSSTPKPRISPTEANTFTPTSTPTTSSNRTEEIQAENRTSERMQKINSSSKNEIQNLTTANFTHMTDLHERTQISPSPNATISQALSEHKILTLTTLKNATIDNLHANIFSATIVATPKLSEDIDNSTANSIPHLSQTDVMSASTFQTRQIEETNPTSNIIKNIYNKVTADSVVNISSSTFGGSASSVIPAETEVATTPKTAVDSEKTLTLNLRITIQTSSSQQKTLAENITKYMPSSETGNPSSTKQITTSQMQNSEPITTHSSTATVSGSTAALNEASSVKLNVRSDPNQVTPFIKSVSTTTSAAPQTESSAETAKETGITSITKQIRESTATLYSNKVTNTAPLTERSNNNVTTGTKATTSIETENEFVTTNLSWTWEETTLAKIADSDRTQQSLPSEETPAPTPAQTFQRTTPRKTQTNSTAASTVTFMQSMTNSLIHENTDIATASTMVTKEEGSSIDQFTQKLTESAGSVTTTSVTPTQAMPSIAKSTTTQNTSLETFQSIPEGTTESPKSMAFLTASTTSETAPSKTNEWYTTLNTSAGSTDGNSSTPSHGESVTNTISQTTTTSVATLQGLSTILTPGTQSETPAGATPSETAKSAASLMSKSALSTTEPSTGGNQTYGSTTSRHTTPTNSTSGSITTGVTNQTAGSVDTLAITTPTQSGPLTTDIHASTTALTSTQMAASITATPTEPTASTKESVTTTRQTTSHTETGFTTPTKTTVPTSADQGNTTSLTSNSTPTSFQTTSNQRTLSGKTLSGQSTGDEKTNMQTETSILKSTEEMQTDVPKPTFTASYTSEGTTLQPPATASTHVSPTSVTRQATKKEGSSIDQFTQELTNSAGSVTNTSVTATQAMPSIAKSTTTQNTSLETFQSIPEGTTESPKRMAFLTASTTSEKIDLVQLTSRASTARLISSTKDLFTTSAQTSSYVVTPTEISAAVTTNPSFSEELTNSVTAHIIPMNLRTATSSVRTQSALIDPSSNLASVTSKSSTTMTHSTSTLHQNTNVAATSVSLSSDGTPSQRTGTATNEDANSSFTPSPSPVTRVFSGNIPATVTFSSLPSIVMVSQTTAAIDSSSPLASPVSTEQSSSNPAQANSTGPQLNSTSFPSSRANILFFKYTPKIATLTPLVFDYPIVNRISFPASNASNPQEQSQNNTNQAGST